MIVTADSEIGQKNILMNGKYGEIKNVTKFDTETKLTTLWLTDSIGQPLTFGSKSIEVSVIIENAVLKDVS